MELHSRSSVRDRCASHCPMLGLLHHQALGWRLKAGSRYLCKALTATTRSTFFFRMRRCMAPANPDEGQPGDARLVGAAAAAADEEQRYDSEDAEFLYGCVALGTMFIYV